MNSGYYVGHYVGCTGKIQLSWRM